MKKTLLSWSSGKDSAWALHVLQSDPQIDVVGLYTVVNSKYDRVAMHGVGLDLLRLQAESVGLPLRLIPIPDPCSNGDYESSMQDFINECLRADIQCMAFGDLFLEDIRSYRQRQLSTTGITPLFPLWNQPTNQLIRRMLASGLRAIITCVDTRKLPRDYLGQELTNALLDEFPAGVDLCAENGEYHTVVVAGPMFKKAIEVTIGEVIERDEYAFADVIPTT